MLRAFGVVGALFSVLLLGSAVAFSAPKTIAIVNLSDNPSATEAVLEARKLLEQEDDLRPTSPGDLARSLEEPLPEGGPDAILIGEANLALQAGDEAFQEFKSRQASASFLSARRLLFSLPPTSQSAALLAEVSFHMALIHLREQNRGLALGELQLLHRLNPARPSIDPVQFSPDVVRAYKLAKGKPGTAANAKITISTTYDNAPIYLDHVLVGRSPLELNVTPGSHIVAVAAPQYQVTAQKIEIDAHGSLPLAFDLIPRSPSAQALALRFEARRTIAETGEVAIREAAATASRLVGSDAVLVLLDDEGETMATLYHPRLDRLSFRRKADKGIVGMLALTIPVPSPTLLGVGGKPPVPRPWYLKPWGMATISGSVALTVIGIFALSADDSAAPTRVLVGQCEFCQ